MCFCDRVVAAIVTYPSRRSNKKNQTEFRFTVAPVLLAVPTALDADTKAAGAKTSSNMSLLSTDRYPRLLSPGKLRHMVLDIQASSSFGQPAASGTFLANSLRCFRFHHAESAAYVVKTCHYSNLSGARTPDLLLTKRCLTLSVPHSSFRPARCVPFQSTLSVSRPIR